MRGPAASQDRVPVDVCGVQFYVSSVTFSLLTQTLKAWWSCLW